MKYHAALVVTSLALCACNGKDGSAKDQGTHDGSDHTGTTQDQTGTAGSDLPQIWVNEVMAQNATTLQDESGSYPDWIELFNPNDDGVDLEGWWLTDNVTNIFKWQFPAGNTVPAHGYLVVFADGDTSQGPEHASFQLGGLKSEDVGLFGPNVLDNPLVDKIEDMGIAVPDVSLARMPDGGPTWDSDTTPTPGAANE